MRAAAIAFAVLCANSIAAAPLATPGGPEPANTREIMAQLRQDTPDFELLLSYGTSRGASAGHIALAVAQDGANEPVVYSANFYADRDPKHAANYVTSDLMLRIPKTEYLYGTSSSLGAKASFGLDYGEVYKRSVVGVRVHGVPQAERRAVGEYLRRMNADFVSRARDPEYQRGEVKYGYTDLNCAKTIASGFYYGAGYRDLRIRESPSLRARVVARMLNANTPSEMAVQLLRAFDARGYRMDGVLYRKWPASPYVDPLADEPVAFKDLPDRFPSAISLDFRNDPGGYEDYDNLYAIALLRNLQRFEVVPDVASGAVRLVESSPASFADASRAATASAEQDSKPFLQRLKRSPS